MGVDTKGCVVTKTKDVFEVVRVINGKVKTAIEQESGVRGFRVNLSENFRLPSVRVSEVSNSLCFNFKFKGEERQLLVHFDCDVDLENHTEIAGDSCLWLSIGCWGSSEFLMKEILTALQGFGKTYIDVNDCDSVGFEEI